MTSINNAIALVVVLGLTLSACDRFGGKPGETAVTTAGADVVTSGTGSPDAANAGAVASGPLPPRLAEISVTGFEPEVIGNVYASDFEDLILDRWDAEGASGRYARGQGFFEGAREAGGEGPDGVDRIEGYWHQASGTTPCDTAREGTHYWGRFQFNFVRDRHSFIGFWGRCEGTTLDRWNGQFVRRDTEVAALVAQRLAAD